MSGGLTKSSKSKSGGKHECNKCGHLGPSGDFRTPHRKGKDGHPYYDLCKPCHGEKSRASRYKLLYNITPEEYDLILKFQNGRCAICDRPQRADQKRLAVDHCHRSGLIRGLLCWACNKALGAFKDDQWRMWKAFFYLFAPPAVQALGEERFGMLGRIKKKAKNRMFGNSSIAEGMYRIRCSPDEFIQQLKLKAMEMNDAKAKKTKTS